MIISDAHRFAFVHIPKCAGVSVKRALRAIDDTNGEFQRIAEHPVLGRIHYAHVPLGDLAVHFPTEYAKVSSYQSVAIIRRPVDRFVSAIHQRLREFKNFAQSQITPEVIEAEATEVMRYLESGPDRLDLLHVHFNRQIDYIARDGQRIVTNLFALGRMDDAAAFIADCTGIRITEEDRKNRTTEIRLPLLKPLVRHLRAPYAALVPQGVRERIRTGLTRIGLYGDVAKQDVIRPGSRLDGFVREHYAADIALHQELV